jgi:hypothetical protein
MDLHHHTLVAAFNGPRPAALRYATRQLAPPDGFAPSTPTALRHKRFNLLLQGNG